MKAIETQYKGYRFRSRLEARWAVFFDALGLDWEYEPEGFDLGDAGWYLPDFYIKDQDIWAEVKANELNQEEREKAFALSSLTGKPVIELMQTPEPSESEMIGMCLVNYYIGCYMQGANKFFIVNDLIKFYLEKTRSNESHKDENVLKNALSWDIDYYRARHGQEHPNHYKNGMVITGEEFCFGNVLAKAAQAARSARFEHGETPC